MSKRSKLDPQFAAALLSSPHTCQGVERRQDETLWQYLERLRKEMEAATSLASQALQNNPLTPLVEAEVGGRILVSAEGSILVSGEGSPEEDSPPVVVLAKPEPDPVLKSKPDARRAYKRTARRMPQINAEMALMGEDYTSPEAVARFGKSTKRKEEYLQQRKLEWLASGKPLPPGVDPPAGWKEKGAPRVVAPPPPPPEPEPVPPPEPEPVPPPEPDPLLPAPTTNEGLGDLGDLINDTMEGGDEAPLAPRSAGPSLVEMIQQRRSQGAVAGGGRAEELMRQASDFDLDAEIAVFQERQGTKRH